MLRKRLFTISVSILAKLILITYPAFSQSGNIANKSISAGNDSDDYLPSWYAGASNYNLFIAVAAENVSDIEKLIKEGADVNTYNTEGVTPLILAAVFNKPESVKTLLKYSPKLDEVTMNFETALLIAVKYNLDSIAEPLIRAGADIDFADNHGASPLHYAALYGYIGLTDMLLYYDASIDSKSDEGFTPLHTAILAGYPDIASLLIDNGANMEARDNDGDTPFLLAAQYGDTITMELLNSLGVDIFAVNNNKQNALSLAITFNQTGAVRYLLTHSEKWKESSTSGIDPYKVASDHGRREIAAILKQNGVPGKITHSTEFISITASGRYTLHDYYTGFAMSVKDPYSNLGLQIGIDTKLWPTRIIIKESNNSYYQYFDKSSMIYGGLFRDFNITYRADRAILTFTASLAGAYNFGNKFRGTSLMPETGFRLIPGAVLKLTKGPVSFFSGFEYMKYPYYKIGPLWMRTGISFNYMPERMKLNIKKIKWS